ncbi:hypothetical protein EOL73_03985 [Candidatus Saccharibacteria bacterium]|nr:hypothetical protein [Candidatus Saccharibacteria bacterium]NCU40889.1 hypothetical protein [Candidatus Saccharibacteria bacterium]
MAKSVRKPVVLSAIKSAGKQGLPFDLPRLRRELNLDVRVHELERIIHGLINDDLVRVRREPIGDGKFKKFIVASRSA